ncbi:MAG: type II secretion system protein [Pseudomonadales bacterium]|nr:type II secretion system protein [Pseudomonadales bacterium]
MLIKKFQYEKNTMNYTFNKQLKILSRVKTHSHSIGFTLIELVICIAIIAVLIAVALPRITGLQEDAHKASVASTGAALASAVVMLRGQWLINGQTLALDHVKGFGQDNIATSSKGWPTDAGRGTRSIHSPKINSAQRCVRIWQALLTNNAAKVSVDNKKTSRYLAQALKGNCKYTYNVKDSRSYIIYNARNGQVSTQL